jgi:hypothetical protein
MPSTSNTIFYRAASTNSFELRRLLSGSNVGLLPDPDHDRIRATVAVTYDEVVATRTMLTRVARRFGLKPGRLAADTAYGAGRSLAWLIEHDIEPHIPVQQ